MRNWDPQDEQGTEVCTAEQDYKDAKAVCHQLGEVSWLNLCAPGCSWQHLKAQGSLAVVLMYAILGIPLLHVDYHRQYWSHVFEPLVNDYALGLTPNPDLHCNKHIKVIHAG